MKRELTWKKSQVHALGAQNRRKIGQGNNCYLHYILFWSKQTHKSFSSSFFTSPPSHSSFLLLLLPSFSPSSSVCFYLSLSDGLTFPSILSPRVFHFTMSFWMSPPTLTAPWDLFLYVYFIVKLGHFWEQKGVPRLVILEQKTWLRL